MLAQDNYLKNTNANKMYNVAIYLRLSKEDELTGQSASIGNQKDYVTSFVVNQGWNITGIYIDDGFSGTNFNRPDFKRMITDIETGKVNLVITKDLSRLGRDYIDTGYYLERYFPQKNVRYIALNDGIDTFESNSNNNDMSPFKSVINDMYAKDISKKVRTSFYTKTRNGEFIGAFAPYGYKKDPNNKNKFIVDAETAPIVKRIFYAYLNGDSMCNIKRTLNNENIPCPAKYKETNSTYKNAMVKRYIWTQETVKRILTNPSYMGNMTQHRAEKINYKVEKYKKIPQDDWVIVEDTHEPLIDKDVFYVVQDMIQRKIIHYEKKEEAFHLLKGLLFCKECGSKLTYRRNSKGKMVLLCSTYTKFGAECCTSHRMNEEAVEQFVLNDLKQIASDVLHNDFYNQFENIKPQKDNDFFHDEMSKTEKRLSEINGIIKSLYEDKVRGILSEELFIHMSQEFSAEKETLSKRYAELNAQKKSNEKNKMPLNYLDVIKGITNFETVDKTTLLMLIEKVEISTNREVEIFYTFKNPYK